LSFLPTSRRKFIGLAAAAGVAAIAGDSLLIEPNHPRVVRLEIELRRWPAQLEGFTIVLLSDFHYDPHFSAHPLKAAISMVNALRPDLIVLTGDFVTVPYFDGSEETEAAKAEPCAALLRQMRAPHGLWAVLGNHDFDTDPDRVTSALLSHGIPVLANRSLPVESKGGRFWLSGLNDVLSGTSDLNATLANVPRDEATVLLAHEPDFADHAARYPIDLQLSGHSHGGQVRIPFLPPLYLPRMARKYYAGLYKIGPLTLYTNSGLGTIELPIRLNCPPEITLLTLRRSPG
jgi:predicted MPP superfamily phosphohydrolase